MATDERSAAYQPGTSAAQRLLLLRCGLCGKKWTAVTRTGEPTDYACPECRTNVTEELAHA